ncbi:MAG: thiamine biosynthesis protein ThiS [Rhodospirillaceae bacterium]|nr:thiamine biosynthesis protein ThiS [Rhodospirillaceae bacterium]|tara:strand:- start:343 stop:579 length:237 start_codon:yes stop_codon:yes gene_type:complete
MQIILNGTKKDFQNQISVAVLIKELGLDERKIAVERNREIVPKTEFNSLNLCEGDQIEIVHFIGGGMGTVELKERHFD